MCVEKNFFCLGSSISRSRFKKKKKKNKSAISSFQQQYTCIRLCIVAQPFLSPLRKKNKVSRDSVRSVPIMSITGNRAIYMTIKTCFFFFSFLSTIMNWLPCKQQNQARDVRVHAHTKVCNVLNLHMSLFFVKPQTVQLQVLYGRRDALLGVYVSYIYMREYYTPCSEY